jgi:hypothetical protein
MDVSPLVPHTCKRRAGAKAEGRQMRLTRKTRDGELSKFGIFP